MGLFYGFVQPKGTGDTMTAIMRDILDVIFVVIGFGAGVLLVTWGQSADIEEKL